MPPDISLYLSLYISVYIPQYVPLFLCILFFLFHITLNFMIIVTFCLCQCRRGGWRGW